MRDYYEQRLEKLVCYIVLFSDDTLKVEGWLKELSDLICEVINKKVYLEFYALDDSTDISVSLSVLHEEVKSGRNTEISDFNVLSVVYNHRIYELYHKLKDYIKSYFKKETIPPNLHDDLLNIVKETCDN